MYQFIPREKVQSILDIGDFPENSRAEIAYRLFVEDAQEAVYVEEAGKLLGVVSIGDLERYYGGGNNTLKINRSFSYTEKTDEDKAAEFFEGHKTFFEFPVVNGGRLEGVMKRDFRYDIRQDQIASLVVSRHLKEQWHRKELGRFLAGTQARVVLYYMEEAHILRRLADGGGSGFGGEDEDVFWKGLSRSRWSRFLGEPDAVVDLKKEFGNFHTETVKGISEIVAMEGEFYRCADGNRVTLGNPENPQGRIIFYGPCTVAGAYCRDGQTIESCLQRMLNQRTDRQIQVVNRGLFNVSNFFSRMMTDELCEKDVAVVFVEKGWITEETARKCVCAGSLTDTFLSIEDLENNILDSPEHCNYKVNERLAEKIYHDLKERGLFDTAGLSGEKKRMQDYYVGSEIMSEILLYMERNGLLREDACGIKGAVALLADPFTDRHRRAVEAALRRVDRLYLFISEDSNLSCSLEKRIQTVKEALEDLGDKVVAVPAGKYLYTKRISRGIRKQRFCDADMEYDCELFGEVFAGFMGIKYRFVVGELHNPVERKYMDCCLDILPRFGLTVEEL